MSESHTDDAAGRSRSDSDGPSSLTIAKDALAAVRDFVLTLALFVYSLGFISQYEYLRYFHLDLRASDIAPANLMIIAFHGVTGAQKFYIVALIGAVLLVPQFMASRYLWQRMSGLTGLATRVFMILSLVLLGTLSAVNLYWHSINEGVMRALDVSANGCDKGDVERLLTYFIQKGDVEKRIDPYIVQAMHKGESRLINEDDQYYYVVALLNARMLHSYSPSAQLSYTKQTGIFMDANTPIAIRKENVITWGIRRESLTDQTHHELCDLK